MQTRTAVFPGLLRTLAAYTTTGRAASLWQAVHQLHQKSAILVGLLIVRLAFRVANRSAIFGNPAPNRYSRRISSNSSTLRLLSIGPPSILPTG